MFETGDNAAVSADTSAETGGETKETKTFTQEEVNAFLAKDRRENAKKYADYDDLKARLAEYESHKSDSQKMQERIEELEKANLEGIRKAVAAEYGMPIELVTGMSEEECAAQGEVFKKVFEDAKPAGPSSKVLGNPTKGAPALNSDALESAIRSKLGIV